MKELENKSIKITGKLFLKFLKIGAFTFGGGYAMIPIIKSEVADKEKWMNEDEIVEIIAVSESTPGPLAVNFATFTGYRIAGVKGAACATLGVVLPSFFIILIISYFLTAFEHMKIVQYAFTGIRAGVLALIAGALVSVGKTLKKNTPTALILLMALILAIAFEISSIYVLIICGLAGLVIKSISGGMAK